jgi:glycosyltransferase involved in cell wall biosynthesis
MFEADKRCFRMKIKILFNHGEHATGGGAGFLALLEKHWRSIGLYTDNDNETGIFLFNSHHDPWHVWQIRRKHPSAVLVHRVDGPMSVYVGRKDFRDDVVALLNTLADGTVFQSQWSKHENKRMEIIGSGVDRVIHNAVDEDIYFPAKGKRLEGRKIKLVASGWSSHQNKGFDVLRWLDANLDWSHYEMAYIGNAPGSFKNIRVLGRKPRQQTGQILRDHDIYIFASRYEACSNALLEAMQCGLPVVAYNGTSNIELVKMGGLLFNAAVEIPSLLKIIEDDYNRLVQGIKVTGIDEIARRYVQFFSELTEIDTARKAKAAGVVQLMSIAVSVGRQRLGI